MRTKILIISKYFYPGYKAGGPIRSLKNLCDELQNELDFYILSGDRDFQDTDAYHGIKSGGWNDIEKYKVFYAAKNRLSFLLTKNIINEVKPDLIYLNSFFDPATILTLIVNKFTLKARIVLASRGELNQGAIKIKSIKKYVYLFFFKLLRLHTNVKFQATNDTERNDLASHFPSNIIKVVPNIILKPILNINFSANNSKFFNLIYLSRIAPIKNLFFLLKLLHKLQIDIRVKFDIYGPIDDVKYWSLCEQEINKLDRNKISCNYKGPVHNSQLSTIYQGYDLFVLPSETENFGHAIFESLACGLPVLISDKTGWHNLEKNKAGFDVSLIEKLFLEKLEYYIYLSPEKRLEWRKSAFEYAVAYYKNSKTRLQFRQLFSC